MKKSTSAHRARGIPIRGIGTILATLIAVAVAALLASVVVICGQMANPPRERHVGSDTVRAVIGSYTPFRRGAGLMMMGDTFILDADTSAAVTLVTKGQGATRVRLPSGCDGAAVTARVGRMIDVRRDLWKSGSGLLRATVSDDEIRSAVCEDAKKRDIAHPMDGPPSRTT